MWDGYDEQGAPGYWAPWAVHARRMEACGRWERERQEFFAGRGSFTHGAAALMSAEEHRQYLDMLEEQRIGA
ncbi:hypothetical protein ABZ897_50755 [Nonomuraea sp. NPDC046802]|uniref:hypothetical protein n=1 Tax=Nonomuraea sp. NPDC046802 TaxID=3154919 RepID=UPI0033D4FFB0